MGPLVISAVDHTNGHITITGHGRSNGDGVARIFSPAGAVPGGSSPTTDYWLIVLDANTVKLASSPANALAGTAITLSDNGSGTLWLLYGIPFTRATTYVPNTGPAGSPTPGSILKSADLNAMQDALKALEQWFLGQPQSVWKRNPGTTTIPLLGNVANSTTTVATTTGTPGPSITGNGTTYFPLVIPSDVLQVESVDARVAASVANATVSLVVGVDAAGVFAAVSGASGTLVSGAGMGITLKPTTPAPIQAGYTFWLKIVTTGGSQVYCHSAIINPREP